MPLIRIQLIISHNSPRNLLLREMIVWTVHRVNFSVQFSNRLHIITARTFHALLPVRNVLMCFPMLLVSLLSFMPFSLPFPDNYNVQQFHVYHQHLRSTKVFSCALLNLWHLIVFIRLLCVMGKSINARYGKYRTRFEGRCECVVDWSDCWVFNNTLWHIEWNSNRLVNAFFTSRGFKLSTSFRFQFERKRKLNLRSNFLDDRFNLLVMPLFPNLHFVSLSIPQRRFLNIPFFAFSPWNGNYNNWILFRFSLAEKIYFYGRYEIFSILFYFIFLLGLLDNTFAFPHAPPATILINIFHFFLAVSSSSSAAKESKNYNLFTLWGVSF